jgi:hypothetical protein
VPQVTLLYRDGCPNWQVAYERLRALQGELGFSLASAQVRTPEEAVSLGFRGSPTVLVDGADPFATGDEPVAMACRVYATADGLQGSPTIEQLRAAVAWRAGR